MLDRLCVCVRPRPESSHGVLHSHEAVMRPDGSCLFVTHDRSPKGLRSWDILWVDQGEDGQEQLQTLLTEGSLPREVLITGPCGALLPQLLPGRGLYANEVLDPDNGPHTPQPTRALSLPAMSRALDGNVQTGKFLTTAVPCVTPSHKAESGHGYGAVAVDQDSALLCRPCQNADLGHAVIKFVFDPMEEDFTIADEPTRQRRLESALAVERNILRLLAGL